METVLQDNMLSLDMTASIWERVFTVAPLVIIGTKEDTGYDLAPKHMVTPLGFGNYFGFVCTPRHATYGNIVKHKSFTVSFPIPGQVMETALSASPRTDCISKSENILQALPLAKGTVVDAPMIKGAYLYLECKLHTIIDDFDDYSLITGTILAAHVNKHYLRVSDKDERAQLKKYPLLAYIAQGRFARVEDTLNFPFPKDYKK